MSFETLNVNKNDTVKPLLKVSRKRPFLERARRQGWNNLERKKKESSGLKLDSI